MLTISKNLLRLKRDEIQSVNQTIHTRLWGKPYLLVGFHHTSEPLFLGDIMKKRPNFKRENNPFYGKYHSEKTKEKIRQKALGRKLSQTTKDKISIKSKLMWQTIDKTTMLKKQKEGRGKPYDRRGNKNPNWKGGTIKKVSGYIMIHQPNHLFSDKDCYVFEHRLVMEKYLGRYLKPEEIVHHKGIEYPMGSYKDRGDNRIENLKLFANISKHNRYHINFRKRNFKGQFKARRF